MLMPVEVGDFVGVISAALFRINTSPNKNIDPFVCGVNVFIVTNFVGEWIWPIGNLFCLLDIRFVDD